MKGLKTKIFEKPSVAGGTEPVEFYGTILYDGVNTTLTAYKNTLGFTPTVSKVDVGAYTIDRIGGFPSGRSFVFVSQPEGAKHEAGFANEDTIVVYTYQYQRTVAPPEDLNDISGYPVDTPTHLHIIILPAL